MSLPSMARSNPWCSRLAVKMNVVGVRSLIDFCHTLKGLKSFIHISTAYSNTNQYVSVRLACRDMVRWEIVVCNGLDYVHGKNAFL